MSDPPIFFVRVIIFNSIFFAGLFIASLDLNVYALLSMITVFNILTFIICQNVKYLKSKFYIKSALILSIFFSAIEFFSTSDDFAIFALLMMPIAFAFVVLDK